MPKPPDFKEMAQVIKKLGFKEKPSRKNSLASPLSMTEMNKNYHSLKSNSRTNLSVTQKLTHLNIGSKKSLNSSRILFNEQPERDTVGRASKLSN